MHNRTPSMAKALALKRAFHVSDMLPPARLWCLHWQASGDAERIALFGALVVSMHFRNVYVIVQVDAMEPNVWEFLRREDGNYAVYHNGKLLSDSIPEELRKREFCLRFGFCGEEYEEIVRQLQQFGKCTLTL